MIAGSREVAGTNGNSNWSKSVYFTYNSFVVFSNRAFISTIPALNSRILSYNSFNDLSTVSYISFNFADPSSVSSDCSNCSNCLINLL